jgi:hypothetical protein
LPCRRHSPDRHRAFAPASRSSAQPGRDARLELQGEDFLSRLTDAIAETGATIAFDAIGGGSLASDIMQAMENAAARTMASYSRYGSDIFKQVYIYGALDVGLTILNRSFGFQWSVSGWLLFPFLQKAGPAVSERLRQRVADELATTFASRYTRVIGLAEALQPDVLLEHRAKKWEPVFRKKRCDNKSLEHRA